MDIQRNLSPLFEIQQPVGSGQFVHQELLDTCERLDLSISHFGSEVEPDKLKMLAELHNLCYPEYFTPQDSMKYVQRCSGYEGFRVFMLSHGNMAVAARWIDDGKPYPHEVPLLIDQHTHRTGSDLTIYGVQIMMHPAYRGAGLTRGLDKLFLNFCNVAYRAEPFVVQRIARQNMASRNLAKKVGFHATPVGDESPFWGTMNYWSRPRVDLSPVAFGKRPPPVHAEWDTTFFPDHPATPYLGKISVVHSYAPDHENLSDSLKGLRDNPYNSRSVVYEYDGSASLLQKDLDGVEALPASGAAALLNRSMTLSNNSVLSGVVHWRKDQIYGVDLQLPQYYTGPDIGPSLVFPNLFVVASKALEDGCTTMSLSMGDRELRRLTDIINSLYDFRLTDFVQVGDHRLRVDEEALEKGYRDRTTLYLDTAAVVEKLKKLPWIASAYTSKLGTAAMYAELNSRPDPEKPGTM